MSKPTLDELYEELKAGKIYEANLIEAKDREWIDGLNEGQKVLINPRPAIVDSLIHELLHRLKPHWSERYVRQYTKKLMASMTLAQLRKFYRKYNQIKKDHPPLEV